MSVPLKLKEAEALLVSAAGLTVIWVSGAIVSMLQLNVAGLGSVLPALSIARTSKLWAPSAREVYVRGEAHDTHSSESRRHSKEAMPATASVPEKAKLAVADAATAAG